VLENSELTNRNLSYRVATAAAFFFISRTIPRGINGPTEKERKREKKRESNIRVPYVPCFAKSYTDRPRNRRTSGTTTA